jgi:hypothetical protein
MLRLYEEGLALFPSDSPESQQGRSSLRKFLLLGLAAYTKAQRAEARMEALQDLLAQREARKLEEEEEMEEEVEMEEMEEEGEDEEEEMEDNEGRGEQEGEGEEEDIWKGVNLDYISARRQRWAATLARHGEGAGTL